MSAYRKWFESVTLAVTIFSVLIIPIELEWRHQDTELPLFFWYAEVFVTTSFTLEYFSRWYQSRRWLYPLQPLAIIDLLALLPFYISLFAQVTVLRLVRLLRLVRIVKLYRYTTAIQSIRDAFYRIRYEFGVIGFALFSLSWVCAVLIYEFEHDAQPQTMAHFSDALWYVIVTLTTVGYGDKIPVTPAGQFVAVVLMLGGLSLFATFVSLIGGAFVEELRLRRLQHHHHHRHHPELPLFTPPAPHAAQTSRPLGPQDIIEAIRSGVYLSRGPEAVRELSHLLLMTCQWILTTQRITSTPQTPTTSTTHDINPGS
jgi:voltage-gated potassium channel